MLGRSMICVLAGDYAQGSKQALGPHSLARLEGACEKYKGLGKEIMFVFSAGRLTPEDARLCDLQADYVRAQGFTDWVPRGEAHALVWGSKAELRFFRKRLGEKLGLRGEVWTENFHRGRSKLLGRHKANLWDNVKFIGVDNTGTPPTRRAKWHERLGMLEAFVPDWVFALPKQIRQAFLRWNIITY